MTSRLSILFGATKGDENNGIRVAFGGGALHGSVSLSVCHPENSTEVDASATGYLLEVTFEGKRSMYAKRIMASANSLYKGEVFNVISLLPPATMTQKQKRFKVSPSFNFIHKGLFHQIICISTERTQFLRVTHTVRIRRTEPEPRLGHRKILVPFRFDIPSSIYGVDKNAYIGDGEESLPPSLSLVSDTVHSEKNFFVRGECNISYGIRARLATSTGMPCGETSRRVRFIPTRDQPLPPLCTADFAPEYVLGASQRIGLFHVLQPKSGCEFSIRTQEPCPLRFPGEKTASTTINLDLQYLYPSPLRTYAPNDCPCPQPNLSLVVRTALEAITFFSTVPRDGLPKQTDVEPGREVVKKTTLGPAQTRKLHLSTWVPLLQRDDTADSGIG